MKASSAMQTSENQIGSLPRASNHSVSMRTCSCGNHTIGGGQCTKCQKKRRQTTIDSPFPTRSLSFNQDLKGTRARAGNTATHFDQDFSNTPLHASVSSSRSPLADTLMETENRTETMTGPAPSTESINGGSSVPCAITGASFTSIPNGVTLLASLIGTKLGVSFDMDADFTADDPSCGCSCGEYRQYVRGKFTSNGSTVTHSLCGTSLHETTFQEDCGVFGGTNLKYGYRSIPFSNSRFTNPDQSTGCTFNGHDEPGIRGSSGDTLGVMLDFRGELIDACDGTVYETAEWSVGGSDTVP